MKYNLFYHILIGSTIYKTDESVYGEEQSKMKTMGKGLFGKTAAVFSRKHVEWGLFAVPLDFFPPRAYNEGKPEGKSFSLNLRLSGGEAAGTERSHRYAERL